jgi:uncharacterized membrane protein YfcA
MAAAELAPYAALVPIALAGATVYGLTGFGSALVTIPLASHFVPLPFAIATFALIDFVNSLRVGLERPDQVVRGEFFRLAPGILAGVAIGVTVLVNLPRKAGMAALGVFIIAYAVYALAMGPGGRPVRAVWGYVAGLAGGVTGTLFGAGGPPYAVYLSHRGLSKDQFRATITMTILVSLVMRLVAFALIGLLWDARIWLAAAACIPAAMLGIALATRLFRRLSREAVARAVALLLLVSGFSLVIRASA